MPPPCGSSATTSAGAGRCRTGPHRASLSSSARAGRAPSIRARTTGDRPARRGSWRTPRGRRRCSASSTTCWRRPRPRSSRICHSFGVLVRWAGIAEAVLRSELKGGKSQGVVSNVLTAEARDHPFFSGFWNDNPGPEIKVLDSRLYDLIPTGRPGTHFLAFEAPGPTGLTDAVTMCEFVRHDGGLLPRIWGVNCHPEIGDRGLQRERLDRMAERGEVTLEWIRERRAALAAWEDSAAHEHSLQRTSAWTFETPVRAHLGRALDERHG